MIHTTSRVLVSDLRAHVDQTVTVSGWVNALRLQRKMQFVILRDHSGMAQVTHKRDGGPLEAVLESLTPESAVRITGRVVEAAQVNLGGLEIVPETIEVLNRAETPLPIDEHTGPEHRLDWRFLDVRKRATAQMVFAAQTTLEQGLREYAMQNGCTEMHTPKLMGTASESGVEVFKLEYFDRSAYLAQSPQFYKQMAVAAGIDRVFEIGPVFRAEPSSQLATRCWSSAELSPASPCTGYCPVVASSPATRHGRPLSTGRSTRRSGGRPTSSGSSTRWSPTANASSSTSPASRPGPSRTALVPSSAPRAAASTRWRRSR